MQSATRDKLIVAGLGATIFVGLVAVIRRDGDRVGVGGFGGSAGKSNPCRIIRNPQATKRKVGTSAWWRKRGIRSGRQLRLMEQEVA